MGIYLKLSLYDVIAFKLNLLLIGSGSSGQPTVFKAETVTGSEMDLPFQPIDPDHQPAVEPMLPAAPIPVVALPKKQSLPDLFAATRDEEESKRSKKKSRKRRKKKCQEQFRLSSESDANDYTFELDEDYDVGLQSENNSPGEHDHVIIPLPPPSFSNGNGGGAFPFISFLRIRRQHPPSASGVSGRCLDESELMR